SLQLPCINTSVRIGYSNRAPHRPATRRVPSKPKSTTFLDPGIFLDKIALHLARANLASSAHGPNASQQSKIDGFFSILYHNDGAIKMLYGTSDMQMANRYVR